MEGKTYRGYQLVPASSVQGSNVFRFEGLGTSIIVENIPSGRNPQVRGRIQSGQGEGDWLLMIPDGGRQFIRVPSSRIQIGR